MVRPAILLLSMLLAAGQATDLVNPFSWGVPVVVFGIIPVLDMLLGKDSLNPDEETDVPRMVGERFYKAITLGWVAGFAALLVWSMLELAPAASCCHWSATPVSKSNTCAATTYTSPPRKMPPRHATTSPCITSCPRPTCATS